MRVAVCGGRDYMDAAFVNSKLTQLHRKYHFTKLAEGGARGVDRFARTWAIANDVPYETFEANWLVYKLSAGPMRNHQIIKVFNPELVVAFPGGRGTADMIRRATRAKIETIDYGFLHLYGPAYKTPV
jgi:hypothetical protein